MENTDRLEQLSRAGDADAACRLGRIYYEGALLPQDYDRARSLFECALESDPDHTEALDYLGYCHYYGRNIPVDDEKALACFQKSAGLGDRIGLYKLGDMYSDGRAVVEDRIQAMRLYTLALDCSEDDAPELPGICLRISELLLDRAQDYLDSDMADVRQLTLALDAALNASEILGRSETLCWRLLSSGDPYAHLSLPGLFRQLTRSRQILGKLCPAANSDVTYPDPSDS